MYHCTQHHNVHFSVNNDDDDDDVDVVDDDDDDDNNYNIGYLAGKV